MSPDETREHFRTKLRLDLPGNSSSSSSVSESASLSTVHCGQQSHIWQVGVCMRHDWKKSRRCSFYLLIELTANTAESMATGEKVDLDGQLQRRQRCALRILRRFSFRPRVGCARCAPCGKRVFSSMNTPFIDDLALFACLSAKQTSRRVHCQVAEQPLIVV